MSNCRRILKTLDGAERGVCFRPFGHSGPCSSDLCIACGSCVKIWSSRCRSCHNFLQTRRRRESGEQKMNFQSPGRHHVFPCGCQGVLPEKPGLSNLFALYITCGWGCRITRILSSSRHNARKHGYKPADSTTSHDVIIKMGDKPCVHCGEVFDWSECGPGKTPHLDHDHETGKINGFSHAVCNPQAMKREIERLKRALNDSKTI